MSECGEARFEQGVLHRFHVGVVVAEGAVFVFDLDGDDGSTIAAGGAAKALLPGARTTRSWRRGIWGQWSGALDVRSLRSQDG